MMPTDREYQGHTVFNDLDLYIAFYKSLAESVFPFVTTGTNAICNIDSYVFSSIKGTLTSICTILRDGKINDAYALLRKYFDSAIITIYSNLYIEENFSLENHINQQINNWLKGKEFLPKYRVMSEYIRKSSKVSPITEILFKDKHYKQIRNRCNDHTHYNFYSNVLLNVPEIHLRNRGEALDEFACDIKEVVILHLAYLFFTKQHYMMSSDHSDYLECGLTPEPDSQYWVAPFIQEIFDKVLKTHRPDIATIIKDHTNMQLN